MAAKDFETIELHVPRFGIVNGDSRAILDPDFMKSIGAHKTKNNMGFSLSQLDTAFEYWVSSLPNSSKPLYDLGAGLGFQTEAAIKQGRTVVAVDAGKENLNELKIRMQEKSVPTAEILNTGSSRLVECVVASLPEKKICVQEGAAGVLLSHVLHFLPGEKGFSLFEDVFSWLEKGGLFAVTCASPVLDLFFSKLLGREVSEENLSKKLATLKFASIDDLYKSDLICIKFPVQDGKRMLFETPMYLRTTNELRAMALKAGFEIVKLKYIPLDFFTLVSDADAGVLLVARKPM